MNLQFEGERVRQEDVPPTGPQIAVHPRAKLDEPPPAALPEDRPDRFAWFRRLLRRRLFVALVLVPNLLSILYFGLIASPIYISRASLLVINPKQNGPSLSSLLAGASGDSSEQGGYILKNYFASWDAFRQADGRLGLARAYRQGDPISRYGGLLGMFRTDDVALWHYFQNKVDVDIEQKSGIVSLDVHAYDPAYAVRLARSLLRQAIARMDAMNAEQEHDFLANGLDRRAAAEADLRRVLAALASYRSRVGTLDPKELYTSDLALMNNLSLKAGELKAQRDVAVRAAPENPQVNTVNQAIASVRGQMSDTQGAFATMARSSSEYEKLMVSRDNAVALLNQANIVLQQAQMNVEKNRYYLNVISQPSEPMTPESPQRVLWMGGVALSTVMLWGLLR